MLALVSLLTVLAIPVFAPFITPLDPAVGDLRKRFAPPIWITGGEMPAILGRDHLGRDIATRILYGGRISLAVGVMTVGVAGVIGTSLGILSGYFGGLIDQAITRLLDIQQSFPFLVLAIGLVAVIGPGIRNIVLVLGISGWVMYARVIRSCTLVLKKREFILAARAIGASDRHILLRHIFPNILPLAIVISTLTFGQMMVAEASLSFLGLGLQPPDASWGLMLSDARGYIRHAWWAETFPGLAIVITVLAANVVGDWLRDYLQPELRRAAR